MNTIEFGDCRATMRRWAADGVQAQMCVTSPPYYGLRDYGHAEQLGLEQTPAEYIAAMVDVFRCVRDVLAEDGTLWLNIGDSYAGSWGAQGKRETPGAISRNSIRNHPKRASNTGKARGDGLKPKDLIGIPWMLAFALRADGWYLRQDIIWHKPNPMPESVTDRCTKAHEYLFLLTKGPRYFYDTLAMREPAVGSFNPPPKGGPVPGKPLQGRLRPSVKRGGFNGKTESMASTGQNAFRAVTDMRNRRSVWTVATRPYAGAHFATFPPALIEPCILAGSRPGDVVLDPFMGSGTTAAVALQHGRQYLGCELNADYEPLQRQRIEAAAAPPTPRPRRRAAPIRNPEPAQRGLFQF